jgi:hypothetical protein
MFSNTHTSQDRLKIWRDLRNDPSYDLDSILECFSSIKICSRYIDYYTPKSWPTPFEIVSEGHFCQSGITLVLLSTLLHKGFILEGEIDLCVISNNINGNTGLVGIQNNKVYNFEKDSIVDIDYLKENATIFHNNKIHTNDILY